MNPAAFSSHLHCPVDPQRSGQLPVKRTRTSKNTAGTALVASPAAESALNCLGDPAAAEAHEAYLGD